MLQGLAPIGSLFLSLPSHARQPVKDKLYSPMMDPILESLASYSRVLKVEMGDKMCLVPGRIHQTLSLDSRPFLTFNAIETYLSDSQDSELHPRAREVEDELVRLLAERFPQIPWENERFCDASICLNFQSVYFYELFKVLEVERAIQLPYYYETGMALNHACAIAGITSIDIQHGVITEDQPHYTHYLAQPEEGYSLLPDLLWTWNEDIAEKVNQ